jgi:beta-N-acetylhexosaminidase
MMLSSCQGSVMTGLDCVGTNKGVFQGKRLGIITNHTAYNSNGKYIVDVLKGMTDVTVTALFSPEHGLWGKEQDAIKIDNQTDPVYHLQIYSLYGKTLKPTREMLQDIDVLVFDIQDIGARFYTYIYTMSLAMEAAAENGKAFIVLDRPNPINGNSIEGNILESALSSFVGLYPIPVRHGMTIGELAKMFNEQGWLRGSVKAELVVIPLKGWHRRMWYDQTGLRFIKPSPNMPDLKTAAIYPGLCLLEGTNVSEGRGTPKPFRQFGAPWIESKRLVDRLNRLNLPGMRFEPVRFTPASSKYQGQGCNGPGIIITDRDRLEPYYSGIRIVNEIYRMYPDDFQWKARHFDRLCGTSEVRNTITNGSSLDKLRNKWQVELDSFRKIREKYLIYTD